jgi:acetyl esterase
LDEFSIPTSAGEIPARLYAPSDPAGVILWIHGGGWVICDLDTHDAMCRLLATESGCEVIAVDYRLAPEHPFPAPLEDAWDALRWVAEQAGDRPVIVAGDSAGGNLAAVCALRARDRGGPELALQVLVYPATSGDLTTPSCAKYGSGRDTFLTLAEMEWFWAHYVGDASDDSGPELRPLRAQDHSGLPPTILVTAEYDPLRDDGFAYAKALQTAGVPVTHHHYDDVVHAFFTLVNMLDRGNEAVGASRCRHSRRGGPTGGARLLKLRLSSHRSRQPRTAGSSPTRSSTSTAALGDRQCTAEVRRRHRWRRILPAARGRIHEAELALVERATSDSCEAAAFPRTRPIA